MYTQCIFRVSRHNFVVLTGTLTFGEFKSQKLKPAPSPTATRRKDTREFSLLLPGKKYDKSIVSFEDKCNGAWS
jgi:hypothetical protein